MTNAQNKFAFIYEKEVRRFERGERE